MANLTILHTNDMHGKLSAGLADRISRVRASAEGPVILLDAGDAVASGNITYRPEGERILALMSDTGYDAMAVGNREFHLTPIGFRAKTRLARFPVLSANIRSRSDGGKPPCLPFVLRDIPGFGVLAIFGITVPMITERMAVRHLSAYTFDDPERTAHALAGQLRNKCAMLICLSHAGLAVDRAIARADTGIDLIVGGHTHAALETGERYGRTLVVQAGSHAKFVGRVTVTVSAGALDLNAELLAL